MARSDVQDGGHDRKKRRHHHKSRNGCAECKRRRIKCDEARPSCTRCRLGLMKCKYPSTFSPSQAHTGLDLNAMHYEVESEEVWLDALSSYRSTESPEPAMSFDRLCTREGSLPALSRISTPSCRVDFYQHYLRHTTHSLSFCESDYTAFACGIPALAQRSEAVLHSLLAVSAVSLAHDMISAKASNVDAVYEVLLMGYHHYNEASARMRTSMSNTKNVDSESIVASSLVLVPFAAASQQIHHWLSKRSNKQRMHSPLSSTPRDIIVIMRGIKTMVETAAWSNTGSEAICLYHGLDHFGTQSVSLQAHRTPRTPSISRTHIMTTMVAATSQTAFHSLRSRLQSLISSQHSPIHPSLSACKAAFDILDDIRNKTFSPSHLPFSKSSPPTHDTPHSWLHSLAHRTLAKHHDASLPPNVPLTRLLLSFYSRIPQAYLDILLPLLDQRLEHPTTTSIPSPHLTKAQALALDIYAHWSVFMLLVEDEAWWIGTLPVVTLEGMRNRFGTGFVGKAWEEEEEEEEEWWPESMLCLERDVREEMLFGGEGRV